MKVRIIEQIFNGQTIYIIQQKHWLFRWWWVDAWVNSLNGASCNSTFYTLERAKEHLCYFDGSKPKQKIIFEN